MPRSRDCYIPHGAVKVTDKRSDAVAYVYISDKFARPAVLVFLGKQAKPAMHYLYRSERECEIAIRHAFAARRAALKHKAERSADRAAKAEAFRTTIQVGDIFHYSFGYDETHHVFYEVTGLHGKFAMVRRIAQAQHDLGYDNRHRCMPQSGEFIGLPVRVLIQDGCIKVDHHYHARKWNTERVAGVPFGPAYVGGGMH